MLFHFENMTLINRLLLLFFNFNVKEWFIVLNIYLFIFLVCLLPFIISKIFLNTKIVSTLNYY